ncbi:MAG: hypothetical protein K0B10_15215 [Vicingaceae bacterium]|nr:hypothetical protein [Vicingaceae bacterium]
MKKILYILILLFSTTLLNAQGVRVSAKLDTNQLLIGEQTFLRISVDYAAESGITTIIFPTFYDTLNQHIEILSKSTIDTLIPDSTEPFLLQQKQELLLTSFDSGYYVIPPFQFLINNDTVETEATLLEVYSLPVDTTAAIFDVKQPIDEPFSFKDWLKENWKWIALGITIILLIIYLIKYLKNRKPTEQVKEIVPDIPNYIIALERLEKLREQKLWQAGKVKMYHSEISEILREYIESRFQINAMEETTDEIMYALRLQNIPNDVKEKLHQTLKLADLVKFAKEQPLANENDMSLIVSIEFINQTKITVQNTTKDA